MKLYFEEYGSGQPIILLHAFPLNGKMWRFQIDELTSAGFRVIVPDLRGFGQSHNFADINLIDDMAHDVAELMDLLQIESAVIGGISMGGYILFSLYKHFPALCSALIFCDTNFSADTDEQRKNRFAMIAALEKKGNDVLIEQMLPLLVSDHSRETNQKLSEDLIRRFAEVNTQAAIAALRGMAERADNAEILDRINVPTLIIFGEHDNVTKPEIGVEINKRISNSTFRVIELAGHYSNMEQPNQFNKVLLDFVDNVR